jgi:hypothetical protein
MKYYVFVDVNGDVVGVTKSPVLLNIANAQEVSEAEFSEHTAHFGAVSTPAKTSEEFEAELTSTGAENKILHAQIQAASDRQDFLEECIAEMATLIYV